MSQPQHEDPFDEARHRMLQGFSALSTLPEAAARFAAVGIQRRAAKEEQAAGRDRAAEAAEREADRLAAAAGKDRERLAARLDGSFIRNATFAEAAEMWRTATVHAAAGDPVAKKVAGLALDRLGELHPQWREVYDRHRAAGCAVPDAARLAAFEVWETEVWETEERQRRGAAPAARPHSGSPESPGLRAGANGRALPAGGQALNDLDAAVRAEVMGLLGGISPEALDRLQRDLRTSGRAPAADGIGLARQFLQEATNAGVLQPAVGEAMARELDAHAARERADARAAAAAADDPRTVVDEHADGQVDATRVNGAGDRDAATAVQQQRWGQAFPRLIVGGSVSPIVAAKQPAQVVPTKVKVVSR